MKARRLPERASETSPVAETEQAKTIPKLTFYLFSVTYKQLTAPAADPLSAHPSPTGDAT